MTARPVSAVARASMAAAVALLVAACAGLPDRGPVEVEESVRPSSSAAPFNFNPPGPVAGASPEQVVAGFLRALQATPAGTAAASEFLTEEAARQWRPDRKTLVYAAARTRSEGGTVRVELEDAFSLDTSGRFAGELTGAARELRLELARDDGEWRIAEPPDALVVPRSYFAIRYRPYSLFFLDPTGSVLVPERVHLPWGPQLPTQLVDGLLAGPADGTRGVERSWFPPDTQLEVSVPVREDGVAVVPLNGGSLDLDSEALERMLAQLAWTLRQASDVEAFRVTVDGAPVELPLGGRDGAGAIPVTAFEGYAPTVEDAADALFVVRDGQIAEVDGAAERVVGPLAPAAGATGGPVGGPAGGLAVGLAGDRFAVVSGDRRRVAVIDRTGTVLATYRGADVAAVTWDRTDRLWVLDRRGEVAILDGEQVLRLPLPSGAGAGVVAAALSRDGTRLALLRRSAAGPGLAVVRVQRDGEGVPVGLTAARRLPTADPLPGARAVAWWDASTVAVLTRPSAATSGVVLAAVDGASAAVRQESTVDVLFDAAATLTADPGAPGDVVVTSVEGRVHRLDPLGGWDLDVVPAGVQAAAYPG